MQDISGVHIQKLPKSEIDSITIDNEFCKALISLQGGQVLQFYSKEKQKDFLWLSELNQYEQGKAIRGGIPLCFPWFGAHLVQSNYPSHGFARNLVWNCLNIAADEAGHHITLQLKDQEQTRKYWDYAFELNMTVHCGVHLQIEFQLINLDQQDFNFSFAWHSYFPAKTKVAKVFGLFEKSYIDKLDQNTVKVQMDDALYFEAEIDRVYPKTEGKFTLNQENNEVIDIQSNAESAIIWNPWVDKSMSLSDIQNDAWQEFVCIENGQVGFQSVHLAAGKSVQFQLTIA